MQIETDRLILRESRDDDWQPMADYWSDPRYQRYYPEMVNPESIVRDLVSRFLAAQDEEPRRMCQLAIERKDDGRMIGNYGLG